jgi:hypothetical protein
MLKACGIALLVSHLVATAPAEQPVRSAALAAQLGAALHEQRLDAIAARDPDEADRFIAALFFQDAQLLVISARYASPPLLDARLAAKQYRDVYHDLSTAAVPDTSLFFQDMSADGLCNSRDKAADILYRGPVTSIFNGDWKSHDRSEAEYRQRLLDADARYSRLLEILIAEVTSA